MKLFQLTLLVSFIAIISAQGGTVQSITFAEFRNAFTSNGYKAPSQTQHNMFRNSARPNGDISSKQEAAMALAQILHESGGLQFKREIKCEKDGCPNEYRTKSCDRPNQFYYGRGYIQLTWCENYKACSQDLFKNDSLVRDPDSVAKNERYSWNTTFWYWKKRVHSAATSGRFGATTRAINGRLECEQSSGHRTARKRFEIYGKVRRAFGLNGNGDEKGCYN